MAADALTDEAIAAAMRRADKVVCPPLDDFCYGLAFSATEALVSTSPQLIERAQEQAARYGTHRYLAKPFQLDALLGEIRAMVGEA
jgi:hypothetical protein